MQTHKGRSIRRRTRISEKLLISLLLRVPVIPFFPFTESRSPSLLLPIILHLPSVVHGNSGILVDPVQREVSLLDQATTSRLSSWSDLVEPSSLEFEHISGRRSNFTWLYFLWIVKRPLLLMETRIKFGNIKRVYEIYKRIAYVTLILSLRTILLWSQ